MEIVNEAVISVDTETVEKTPSQGLMCLDACKCTGNCGNLVIKCS